MIFLFLAILCSSSIALIFKFSESRKMNRYAITSVNYLAAFLISLAISLKDKLFSTKNISIAKFGHEFKSIILENSGMLSIPSSFLWAIIVGIFAGFFFFGGFIYYQKSVKENGASLSGMFGKLGILMPMIFSIILWKELPTSIQWTGIALALTSIILANIEFERKSLRQFKFTLILLFFFMGMAEFSNKIFQKYAINQFKSLFLFFVFFTAFLFSLFVTIKHGKAVTIKDILIGICVGIPNLFSSYFLIMALNSVKTSVAFPIFSASGIVVIVLGGWVIFKEKLKPKDIVAIGLTIVALVLINL